MNSKRESPIRNDGMLLVQREKRQMDVDETLLANRILKLDTEQAKMLKKIEKTRS